MIILILRGVGIVLTVLTMVFAGWGLIARLRAHYRQLRWLAVPGVVSEVVEFDAGRSSANNAYEIIVRYSLDGVVRELASPVSRVSRGGTSVGQAQTVHVNPRHHDRAEIIDGRFGKSRNGLFLYILAAVLGVCAVVLWFLTH